MLYFTHPDPVHGENAFLGKTFLIQIFRNLGGVTTYYNSREISRDKLFFREISRVPGG